MLGKLLKYEFKHTGRYILFLLLALIVITPVTAFYTRFYTMYGEASDYVIGSINILSVIQTIAMILYVCTLIAVIAASVILLMYRFYRSMVTGEGYLTHTLPVSTSYIVFSKLFVAFVWIIICGIIAFISIATFVIISTNFDIFDIDIELILKVLKENGVKLSSILLFVLLAVLTIIQQITQLSASLAVGHRLNNHPILGSVLTYIVFDVVLQIVSSIAMVFFMTTLISAPYDALVYEITNPIFIVSSIIQFIFCAIFYFITVYMFKKKLNI